MKLLPLARAAEVVGITGSPNNRRQKLLRVLERFEQDSGRRVLISAGGHRYVTEVGLREAIPTAFDLRSEGVERIREHLERIDERFESVVARLQNVERALRGANRGLASQGAEINRLRATLDRGKKQA